MVESNFYLCSQSVIMVRSKDSVHYRNFIPHEFNSGYSATEAHRQINTGYPGKVGDTAVREWYNKFEVVDLSLENKPRIRRPSDVDEDILLQPIEDNTRLTPRDLTLMFGTSQTTVRNYLFGLG